MTKELRRVNLKAKIQTAATAVFLEKGYAETRISDIAAAACISSSTIYLYFSGKKELFASLDIPQATALRPGYEKKRESVLRTALILFGEHGFEGTTMDIIAEGGGFSKAALYQYCTSKEDLFFQVLQLYTRVAFPSQKALGLDSSHWKKGIRTIAHGYMAFSHDPHRNAFFGSVIRDSNQFPVFGAVYYEKSYCAARRLAADYLRHQQALGTVRTDINADTAVCTLLGSLTSYIVLYKIMNGIPNDVDENAYVEQAVDIFIRGVEDN